MRYHQISENKLAALERVIHAFGDRHMSCLNAADKVAIRQIQRVLRDVRWNYGPPQEVEVEADDDEGEEWKA